MKADIDYSDVLFLIGLLLIASGVFFIYPPAVLILIGLAMVAFGIVGSR